MVKFHHKRNIISSVPNTKESKMVKSINTKLSRILLLLISFAMLLFLIACGGSIDDETEGSTSTGMKISAFVAAPTTLVAGQSSILTVMVTDNAGAPVSGQAVTFNIINDKSEGAVTTLGLGVTDAGGQAVATYTAGEKSPTENIQVTIQASVAKTTSALFITRTASTGTSSTPDYIERISASPSTVNEGQLSVIEATIYHSGEAANQTITFTIPLNNSGASFIDSNGASVSTFTTTMKLDSGYLPVTVTYKAGTNVSGTMVEDIVQAKLGNDSASTIIITRISSGTSTTGLVLTLKADKYSLAGGESTIITAKVTNGTSAVKDEPVTFGFSPGGNRSGASLTNVSATTDAAGEATALYTAGTSALAVQDIVQATITGSTKAIIINKTGTTGGTTVTAAHILISASPLTVKSDGSTSSTITVIALNDVYAALSGVTVTLGTDTGVLSAPTVVTNTTTPATVTFRNPINTADPTYAINRTATISTAAGTATAQIPIQIVDSTLKLTASGTTLPDNGTSFVTLTATLKDSGGNPVPNAVINWSRTGAAVSFTPSSSTTDTSGQATTKVTSTTAGPVTIIATAPGKLIPPALTPPSMTASTDLTVTSAANTFYIDQLNGVDIPNETNKTTMKIGDSLVVRVNAPYPDTEIVMFATTIGVWDGTSSVKEIPVVSGKATATLTTTAAGLANVQVYRKSVPSTQDNLTVAMTAKTPYRITLQTTPSTVPKSVGTTTGYSTLIATVFDNLGYPVSNVPVSFSIVRTTGGGESVSPVVVYTAEDTSGGIGLGEARTQFTSGSLTSDSSGVQIRASVVGTFYDYDGAGPNPPLPVATDAVGTDATPNGNDAKIIIGEVAGSVAFGIATTLTKTDDKTQYIQNMSVLVTDAGGNPVPGALVTLSVWPIAWSTGSSCSADETFWNEDINENLILDPGEDGKRTYYKNGTGSSPTDDIIGGTQDGLITPTNSWGGAVPATVTTANNGVGSFQLTYPISSAIWTYVRVRASVIVSGSETVGQIIFLLAPLAADVGPPCAITGSPYNF